MSEEEIIDILQHYLEMEEFNNAGDFLIAIDKILDLYNAEKEKNKEKTELTMKIIGANYISKNKIKELAKKYEYASVGYDSLTADYKQSQDIGRYIAYVELLKGE